MRERIGLVALVCAIAAPAVAVANEGVLVLAHNGTPEWNAKVKDLVAKVNGQKAAEVVFGVPRSTLIAPAIERLAKRGVTNVTAVPLLLTTPVPAEDLTGHAVPVQIASGTLGDPIFAEVVLSRVEAISRKANEEVLVLVGYGSDDSGTAWRLDLGPLAQRLNGMRRFASILTAVRPDTATDREKQQIRLLLERHSASGRRILVLPVLHHGGDGDPAIAQLLEGFSYELTSGGILSDDRVANWIAASASSR